MSRSYALTLVDSDLIECLFLAVLRSSESLDPFTSISGMGWWGGGVVGASHLARSLSSEIRTPSETASIVDTTHTHRS